MESGGIRKTGKPMGTAICNTNDMTAEIRGAADTNQNLPMLQISVALVTRNRPDSLERTLQSLRAQSVQPFEVVISDDSDEARAAETRELAVKYGCRYTRGPQRGLYANRNHAARACQGTHIRAMDDDHTFQAGHFARCLEEAATEPAAVWLVSEYIPADEKPGEMPQCPPQLHPRGFSTVPPDPQNCWSIADGSTIYPRAIFDSGIHFEEAFKFGASYLEFGSLLYHLGYHIRSLQGTYLIHHYIAGGRSYANEEMEQGSCFFAMFCHSFLYQPTLRNRVLTCLEVGKQMLLRPRLAYRALKRGTAAFRRRRQWLSEYKQGISHPLPSQTRPLPGEDKASQSQKSSQTEGAWQ